MSAANRSAQERKTAQRHTHPQDCQKNGWKRRFTPFPAHLRLPLSFGRQVGRGNRCDGSGGGLALHGGRGAWPHAWEPSADGGAERGGGAAVRLQCRPPWGACSAQHQLALARALAYTRFFYCFLLFFRGRVAGARSRSHYAPALYRFACG